ncbi:histidine phosphatase family protein [Halobacillus salinus]|uniref:histidine phosphatase family protein n=1 Tax=Halobacillus salinus TaxID=192814 RepID=UPI0009A7A53A|nr:histidine phosphatase family protein [Halobacillus salinus]
MELIFIRHGAGEHTLHPPESLQIRDPHLTGQGIEQAKQLQEDLPLTEEDMLLVSPVRRTLETVAIWSEGIQCKKLVSPLVSPRMFPQNPEWTTLPCDRLLSRGLIEEEFPMYTIDDTTPETLWTEGINTMPEELFKEHAEPFLSWCKSQERDRLYIVSHDGTITSYRQLISGKRLTRKDFPKETASFKLKL